MQPGADHASPAAASRKSKAPTAGIFHGEEEKAVGGVMTGGA
jgi:hypothetical protein